MGNCFRKLPWLVSYQHDILDEECFDPDPCDMNYVAPKNTSQDDLMGSVMSASFIETDKNATELIRKLG